MKKYIVLTISLLIILTGCDLANNKKIETNIDNVKKSEATFEKLVSDSKEILKSNESIPKSQIIYSNSPYGEYIKVYLDKDSGVLKNKLNITTDVVSFELIKEEKELAAAFVTERTLSSGETSNIEVESDYYYVFKKEKGKWKIYDFIPTKFAASEEKILELYKSK